MKVFSKTHSIAAAATAAVEPVKGTNGKKVPDTYVLQFPAGTVLDLDDDVAADMIAQGIAVEYDADEHKAVNGIVSVGTAQVVAPSLPEGFTQPVVVRQDATLNDGTTAATVAGPVVLRDMKNDAQVEADKKAALEASQRTAPVASVTPKTAATT